MMRLQFFRNQAGPLERSDSQKRDRLKENFRNTSSSRSRFKLTTLFFESSWYTSTATTFPKVVALDLKRLTHIGRSSRFRLKTTTNFTKVVALDTN